jgi:hypothetical protein
MHFKNFTILLTATKGHIFFKNSDYFLTSNLQIRSDHRPPSPLLPIFRSIIQMDVIDIVLRILAPKVILIDDV